MGTKLKEYLSALHTGQNYPEIISKSVSFLLSKDIKFLSDNRIDVAALFYQILCSYQRLFEKNAETVNENDIIKLFEHIALINAEPDIEHDDSNLMTIWFLNQLNKRVDINDEKLKGCINTLLHGLSDIHFIFELEIDGEKVFPVNRLISEVITDSTFLNVNSITPYHVQMLQLAVQLFVEDDYKLLLEKLIKDCGLEFLNYMDGSHSIIDTTDFLNYLKNGVMIFYNSSKNSILIRNEKKSYFSINGVCPRPVKEEKNYHGKVIGHYVIIEDLCNAEMIDFSIIMKDNPAAVLKLIYEKNYYNIFLENALLKDGDEIQPLNPYAVNDPYIIKGYLDKKGKCYTKDNLQECIRRFRMLKVGGNTIDAVTFGLYLDLLEKDNVGIDLLDKREDALDWGQNQVIKNWVLNAGNKKDALLYILRKYCTELSYCKNVTRLETYNIKTQDLLPYQINWSWIYELLEFPADQYSILMGMIELDEEGKAFLQINKKRLLQAICIKVI